MAHSNFRRQAHFKIVQIHLRKSVISLLTFLLYPLFFHAKSNVASVHSVRVTLVVLTGGNLEELARVV